MLPVGVLAGAGVVLGLAGMLVAAFAVVFGAAGFFCPIGAIGCLIGVQLLFAWWLRIPVRGPAEPMGPPPDEE
jgi:hypothetical protein